MGTKKYEQTLDCQITSKSKNTTYVHKGDGAATITFNVQKDDVYEYYTNIPMISNGKDLVIKTIFYSYYYGDTPGKTKTVITTIKNYKDLNLNGSIHIKSEDFSTNAGWNINHDVEPGHNGLYGQVSETGAQEFLLGPEGNETITLSHGGSDYIHSYTGNNTWNMQSNYYTTRSSSTGHDTIYEAAGNDKYHSTDKNLVYVYELSGKDEYKSDGGYSRLQTWDFKGNDKYTTKNKGRMDIYDYNGNDEYALQSADRSNVYDFKGNDKYDFFGASINVEENAFYRIEDYTGKDKYTIKQSKGIQIDDTKGNDTYEVSDCTDLNISSDNNKIVISDYVGNDKYTYTNVSGTATNANYDITDGAGNDKYTFDNSEMLHINDMKGADTYNFTNGSTHISVADDGGKDTYNLAGSSESKVRATITDNGQSNDKYNLTYAKYGNVDTAVTDDGGKDTYKIISSDNVKIADVSGNDKYNISGSGTDTITITDESGKDTYNIKGSYDKKTGDYVYLKDVTVSDTGAGGDKYNIQYANNFDINENGAAKNNDSYNITNSYGEITEAYGNDSYTISKLRAYGSITISDSNGEKDKLVLKDVNKKNLVALADIRSTGSYRFGSLLLFDESSRGFVNVQSYYHTDGSGAIDGTANGELEIIKAGSKKIDASSADVYGNFNEVKQAVANWLCGNGHEYGSFDNVEAVLKSGNDDAINSLIAEFTYNQ